MQDSRKIKEHLHACHCDSTRGKSKEINWEIARRNTLSRQNPYKSKEMTLQKNHLRENWHKGWKWMECQTKEKATKSQYKMRSNFRRFLPFSWPRRFSWDIPRALPSGTPSRHVSPRQPEVFEDMGPGQTSKSPTKEHRSSTCPTCSRTLPCVGLREQSTWLGAAKTARLLKSY